MLTGAHDDAFRSLGRNLAARGRGDSYLRLGWQFNGDWYGNIGYSQVRHDLFAELYPGDGVVGVVGVVGYDVSWYHVRDELSWRRYRTSEGGLERWLGFAQQHHRRFAVPEWGLNVSGGGDNPYYINKMQQFFAANARSIYAQLWGLRR